MKLYLAAIYTSNISQQSNMYRRMKPAAKYARDNVEYILESYHYVHKQQYVDAMRRDGNTDIFLDSGAFTMFSQGVDIDIVQYSEYIKRNGDIIGQASVLDSFDGGVQLARAEYPHEITEIYDQLCRRLHNQPERIIEKDIRRIAELQVAKRLEEERFQDTKKINARKTYQNQVELERLGCGVLPCFHFGEDPVALEYYVKNYDSMTIGGMVPVSNNKLLPWLDEIWGKYLTKDGKARLKVHGFGLTAVPLMERYPWYSVDSSSWVQISRTGHILIPGKGVQSISADSPKRHDQNQHFDTNTKIEQAELVRQVESRGFTIDGLKTDYLDRWAFCMMTYGEQGRLIDRENKYMEFRNKQPSVFDYA